jgi:hypothetical protein
LEADDDNDDDDETEAEIAEFKRTRLSFISGLVTSGGENVKQQFQVL